MIEYRINGGRMERLESSGSGSELIVDKDGIPCICPAAIAKKKRDEYGECADPMEHCPKCRREFWGQEVE